MSTTEWHFQVRPLARTTGSLLEIVHGDRLLSFADVLSLWKTNEAFRDRYTSALIASGLDALKWETPALTDASQSKPYECVLLAAPGLNRSLDEQAFAEHFDRPTKFPGVTSFANLAGDAELVVPLPRAAAKAYVHLVTFLRQAPREQVHSLWQTVADRVLSRLGESPLWLSTAGMGVAWLHVRLDSRPKYYGYAPYCSPTR